MKQIYAFALLISTVATAQVSVNFGNSVCAPGDCTQVYAWYANALETTSYDVEPIPYNPYAYGEGIVIPFETDDSWSVVSLGFNFSFYGTLYNQVQIGANGVLAFANLDGFCAWNYLTPIPDSEFPIKNAIYGVYQDVDLSANEIVDPEVQNISYYFTGIAPFRALVVNFNQLPFYQCGGSVGPQTSQIILQETTNEIIVNVGSRTPCISWNSGNGVIGIQNANGTSGIAAPGRNTGAWSATHESWRFMPTGGSIASLEWFMNGVSLEQSAPLITVCQADATYSVIVTYDNDGSPITFTDEIVVPLGTGLEQNPDPSDLYSCSDNGMAMFDLTLALPEFLNGDAIENYEVGFFTTQADAENFANPISFPTSFMAPDATTVYLAAEDYLHATGCFEVRSFTLHIGQGLPAGDATQIFQSGQTLNDLEVTGNGITWYDMPQGGNLLPGTTPLVHNTTYHAQSSPVPGCDAGRGTVLRLAVTALQENLSTANFDLHAVKVAPNPVTNQLNVSGLQSGYSIDVTNLLGQKVLRTISTGFNSTIDTDNWASGTYLIRVSDASNSRTLKIIKS